MGGRKKNKNGKTSWIDRIVIELIKDGEKVGNQKLWDLFNHVHRERILPE